MSKGFAIWLTGLSGAGKSTIAQRLNGELTALGWRGVEVYVRCSVTELSRRDVKGLYEKALRGEIENFTGISDPYEEPQKAEIVVDSEHETLDESVGKILDYLQERGYTARAQAVAAL